MQLDITSKADSFTGACERLLELIEILRSKNGCPWDRKQTPSSMRPCLIEEMFEAVDAITQGDVANAREELGDLLFNTFLTSYIYEQNGDFSIADVLNEVTDKLIRRHPHVFENKDYAKGLWDTIKSDVEGRKKDSVLDEVPKGFPPLMKSYKYLRKAAKEGFDWPGIDDAKAKVKEEFAEVEEAEKLDDKKHLEEEIGDLLLSVVNLSRFYGIDPSVALSEANSKFYDRFTYVEKSMKESHVPMDSGHLKEMEGFWKKAKQAKHGNKSGH